MTRVREFEPTEWREGRRLRAWDLHQQGWKQKDIATALGVSAGAVSQWLKRGRTGGVEQLRRQPPPGAQPRLSLEQLTKLRDLLAQGAEAFGFIGEVWTSKRSVAVINELFFLHGLLVYFSRLSLSHKRPFLRHRYDPIALLPTTETG